MWDIGATETLNRLVNDKRPYTPTTGKGVYNVVYGSNMPKKGEAVFGTGGDSRALGDKNKNVNVNAAFPVAQNTNQNISGFPAVKTNTLGVQKTGGVVKTNNSKNTKNTKNTKTTTETSSANKAREDARKALERQMEAEQGGLRGSYESNLQVLQNLMTQLDPTYARYQQEYQTNMEGNKQKDLNALSAQFAAYGTGDSEQRAQSQERMYNEYQKSYSDYLANLEQQKQAELSGYGNQRLQMEGEYQKGLGDIKARRYAGESEINQTFAKLAQEARQQQFDNQLRLQQLNQSSARSGLANSGVDQKMSNFINRANSVKTQQGGDWNKVANQLYSEGYDVSQGDYRDYLDSVMLGKPISTPKTQYQKIIDPMTQRELLFDPLTGDLFDPFSNEQG